MTVIISISGEDAIESTEEPECTLEKKDDKESRFHDLQLGLITVYEATMIEAEQYSPSLKGRSIL